ncbi:MAG: sigma 54-interacting transcriptional regulator, partial [Mailhella sp.]|nr:sigma 54-interacting transcriptional regulator [Mailhella sp.]
MPLTDAAIEEIVLRTKLAYKTSGLQTACSVLIGLLKPYLPVERIVIMHLSRDLSFVVTLMDSFLNRSKETLFRQSSPLANISPKDLTTEHICNDLTPLQTEDLINDPRYSYLPFLNHKSLLRWPFFIGESYSLLVGFFSDEKYLFSPENASIIRRCFEPLAEALTSGLTPLSPQDPYVFSTASHFDKLTMCPSLSLFCSKLRKVAPTPTPVLLLGETGTGKECAARAIHELSPRKNKPFIALNCGALPESLLEAQLFGYERGAFTGASTTFPGCFEQAHTGTLFLDEIGEMPLSAQVRLLRILENPEVTRLGGTRSIPVDFRIIAATQRDLRQMVKEGTFRQDLWYRLAVFPMNVPSLRHRKGDIAILASYFLQEKVKRCCPDKPVPDLSERELNRLYAHDWPGNIRELEHLIEYSLILWENGSFALVSEEPQARDSYRQDDTECTLPISDWPTLDKLERRYLQKVLDKTGMKLTGAGGATDILGIHYSTLRKKMLRA